MTGVAGRTWKGGFDGPDATLLAIGWRGMLAVPCHRRPARRPRRTGRWGCCRAGRPAPFVSADPDLAPPTGLIGKMCQAIDDCRRKICKAPCGQLINGMTAPISGLTGGVIPMFCPEMPGVKDLMKPGVMGEAAAVKKDALEAKARRQAVRMLGTVDCRYYADAADKLILALRTDGVECVRLEAAWALGSGCCCQPKVVEALDITVAGLETDGNPAERSPRVRDAAAAALANCLACAPPAPPADVLPDPKRKSKERTDETETETAAAGNDAKKASSRRVTRAARTGPRHLALYQPRIRVRTRHRRPRRALSAVQGCESHGRAGAEMAKPLPTFTGDVARDAGPEPRLKPFAGRHAGAAAAVRSATANPGDPAGREEGPEAAASLILPQDLR